MKSLRISEIVNGKEKWILLVHEGDPMYSKISKAIEEELFKKDEHAVIEDLIEKRKELKRRGKEEFS